MGLGGIGPGQLLIILLIVVLLFGTKKLKGLGGDLGGALKGFKKAMNDDDANKDQDTMAKVEAEQGESVDTESVKEDSKSETKS